MFPPHLYTHFSSISLSLLRRKESLSLSPAQIGLSLTHGKEGHSLLRVYKLQIGTLTSVDQHSLSLDCAVGEANSPWKSAIFGTGIEVI